MWELPFNSYFNSALKRRGTAPTTISHCLTTRKGLGQGATIEQIGEIGELDLKGSLIKRGQREL
jgi:hypothetical protein